jgi:hypothetical protein
MDWTRLLTNIAAALATGGMVQTLPIPDKYSWIPAVAGWVIGNVAGLFQPMPHK